MGRGIGCVIFFEINFALSAFLSQLYAQLWLTLTFFLPFMLFGGACQAPLDGVEAPEAFR